MLSSREEEHPATRAGASLGTRECFLTPLPLPGCAIPSKLINPLSKERVYADLLLTEKFAKGFNAHDEQAAPKALIMPAVHPEPRPLLSQNKNIMALVQVKERAAMAGK